MLVFYLIVIQIMKTQLEYLKTREHKDRSLFQQLNLSRFSWVF